LKVFVAGASGVIGRPLVQMLHRAGHAVRGMTRSPERAEALRAMGVEAVICDALDAGALRSAVVEAKPDVVVHQLTQIPRVLDLRRYRVQLVGNDRLRSEGTRHLVSATLAAGAHRLVAQSVAFAYAPTGPRVVTEEAPLYWDAPAFFQRSVRALAELEQLVTQTAGLHGVVLRYGYFYGPGTHFASDGGTAEAVRHRRYPIVGAGAGVFSFIHVEDAAAATVAALAAPPGAYNIVDDEPAPLREWLPVYAAALGAPPPRGVPRWLARLVLGAGPVGWVDTLRGASNEKVKRALGWHPRYPSWRSGFREALSGAGTAPHPLAEPGPV
jgi:nucleoside-diphosphate-sugar epimerase